MHKTVKCDSGLEGWQGSLQDQYDSFDEFCAYDEVYGLASRLGYADARDAWDDNPTVQGSVIPNDYRRCYP